VKAEGSVEEALKKLEEITARLEQADLSLDEALALFEEGLPLAASIKEGLDEAKARIDQVIETTKGAFELEPFDLDSG
jgi:exodeoxyribonuclease VII small subunit